MPSVTGSSTISAWKIATTWGTPVAVGAGSQVPGEITYSANVSELTPRQIGTGNVMVTSATKAQIKPVVNLTMDLGYDNNADLFMAQFFGTAGTPTQQTVGQGDYKHTLTLNTSINSKYLTGAFTSTTSTTIEFPTCATRTMTIKPQSIPGYIDATYEILANDIAIASATNTYAVVSAATARTNSDQLAATAFNDAVWINDTTAGALSSSDKLNIIDWSFTLTRPQDLANEITGTLGNGAPLNGGLVEGTLTVTLKELPDHTWFTAWVNETKKKVKLSFDGLQIGTGVNRSYSFYFPQMQLIQEPSYGVSAPGINPVTLTFKLSKATSNPTGMTSTYPYVEVINTRATDLLA